MDPAPPGTMSAPSAPGSARQRARERIVEAALSLWLERPDASMDDVAARAGVVRRTLYGHFRGREELIAAAALRATDFLDDADPGLGPADEGAAIRLASMVIRLWAFGSRLRLVPTAPQAGALSEAKLRITAAVETIVAEGQSAGEFSGHLAPQVAAAALEAVAAALHDAAEREPSRIGARDVALASLMLIGVAEGPARQLVERIPPAGPSVAEGQPGRRRQGTRPGRDGEESP